MLPLLKAEELGTELNLLSRDDGARLAEILAELHAEARREPGNLITATALTHALSLAGRAAESRAQAQASLRLMSRLPAVPARARLNVLSGLANSGQFADIGACVAPLLTRGDLDPEQSFRLVSSLCATSLRTGDLSFYHALDLELAPELAFLQASGLADWWPRQQRAVEDRIGARVALDAYSLAADDEGVVRLILDYYTDAGTPEAVEALIEEVDLALDEVYADHPEGPGVLLGKVILAVHGPRIPLPGDTP